MNKDLIQLIDKITIAATMWDLAKNNLHKAEKEYNELLEVFNEEIVKVDPELVKDDEELTFKLALANKIFEALNVEQI